MTGLKMGTINTATFNRKVSFQIPTNSKTSMGAPQKSYAHSFYAWCSRRTSGGKEQYVGQRLVVPGQYVYKTHYRSSIDETMRIVDDGVDYNIVQVDADDMKMFIDILVEKILD